MRERGISKPSDWVVREAPKLITREDYSGYSGDILIDGFEWEENYCGKTDTLHQVYERDHHVGDPMHLQNEVLPLAINASCCRYLTADGAAHHRREAKA